MANRVLNKGGLEKFNYKYRLLSQVTGKDGTCYTAYQNPDKKEGNYISSIAPDGTVNWDISPTSLRLESLKLGKDGSLYIRDEKSLYACHPDGRIKFKHTFDSPVEDHFIDERGNNYFRGESDDSLYIVNPEGGKIRGPLCLRAQSPSEIKPGLNNQCFFRKDNRIVQVDQSTGKTLQKFEVKDPDSAMNRSVNTFQPTSDGGFRRPHMHIPPDYRMTYTTVINKYLFKLDSDGNLQWVSPDLESNPHTTKLSDDRVVYEGRYNYSDKKAILKILDHQGKPTEFASLDGGSVTGIFHRESDDHIMVQQSENFTRVSPDGQVLVRFPREGSLKDMNIRGVEKDGQVILEKENSIYHWNPDDGAILPLTDHGKDYSYKLVHHEEIVPEADGDKKTVEEKESHVIISGVKLPVNRK